MEGGREIGKEGQKEGRRGGEGPMSSPPNVCRQLKCWHCSTISPWTAASWSIFCVRSHSLYMPTEQPPATGQAACCLLACLPAYLPTSLPDCPRWTNNHVRWIIDLIMKLLIKGHMGGGVRWEREREREGRQVSVSGDWEPLFNSDDKTTHENFAKLKDWWNSGVGIFSPPLPLPPPLCWSILDQSVIDTGLLFSPRGI